MKNLLSILLRILPDRWYIQLLYFKHFGRFANLKSPKTYNEKLQWLKLNNRNPLYTTLVDKYKVKEYVANVIGEQYVIPTIATYSTIDEIDVKNLPSQFVIKWNHDSGSIVICRDKTKFNKEDALKKLKKGETTNGYWYGREWPYKGVKPLIMIEEYKEDKATGELRDYKFFCFNGVVKSMFVASCRQTREEPYFDFYDDNFNWINVKQKHPNSPIALTKPLCFEKMKDLAAKLSAGFPHVRIDFYEVDGNVYFGEFTFYHFSGFVPFLPDDFDYKMGEWTDLSLNFNIFSNKVK